MFKNNLVLYKIVLIYLIIIIIDLPMIMNNKMYYDMFYLINNNQGFKLKKNIYLSGFLVYFLMSLGLYYFVIKNSINYKKTLFEAFIFGIILYGVYNGTNHITIQKYNYNVAIIDTIWGGILLSIVTAIYLKIQDKFLKMNN
jgi:hypothetical protein